MERMKQEISKGMAWLSKRAAEKAVDKSSVIFCYQPEEKASVREALSKEKQ